MTFVDRAMLQEVHLKRHPYYSEHALERMAQARPSVVAELVMRVARQGLLHVSEVFRRFVDPRGISFESVDYVVARSRPEVEGDKFIHTFEGIRVVVGKEVRRVITVFRLGRDRRKMRAESSERLRREAVRMRRSLVDYHSAKKLVRRVREHDVRARQSSRRAARDAKYHLPAPE